MQENVKSKKERLEKLRIILDNPSNGKLHPEDEKHLEALRRRLVGSSKESTVYIHRSIKEDSEERIDPLKPQVKIYHKEEKKEFIDLEKKRIEPEEKPEKQEERVYDDEDLYEVEKVKIEGPEFLEVKPKEVTEKKERSSTVETEESPKILDSETTTAEDKKLPEWEPVETKNHEFTEVEEIKEEIKSEPVAELPPPPENDVFLPVEKKELDETKKEIEEKKKELELAEKRAKEEAEELKEKKKEKLEKEKEEKKLKKLELKKAKMEEREREKKLRKEAKIEEKKKILEAKMALKESNRKNNENAELEKKKEEIETINGQLNTKEELIRQLQTELEDRNNNLESTSNELNKKEEEMTRLQTDLQQKTAELEKKELEEAEELKRKERERSEREKEEKKIKKMELKKAKMEAKERERELRKKAKIEEKKTRLEAKNSLKERKELENKISEENPEFKDETFEQKEGTTLEEKPGEKITSIDRDVKIDIFRDIKSIDEETAVLLHNGGFTSIDAVSKASLKDLIRIGKIEKKLAKNVKREIEQKLEESSTKTEEEPGEYFILDEGFDEGDAKKIDENISKHKFVEEDKDFFGEEDEVNKENKKIDVFKDINNIDEKTASLLYENGITSVDILREKSVRELTRIKGIRRKLAKRIKKEIEDMDRKTEDMKEYDEKSAHDIKDEPFVEEKAHDEEWESYGTDEMQKQGYTYEDYTLYKKKIETKSGKKRFVRFFSKAEPEEGEPSELPTGFEVKVNKKTGLPYLKKKK